MKSVLFLVHRIPFPPNKGDKIRSYHMLKFLSEKTKVYLGSFVDDPFDWQYEDELNQFTEEQLILPRKKHHQALVRYAKALFNKQPLSNALYFHPKMKKWIKKIIKEKDISTVVIFSSVMAQYISPKMNVKKIVDYVDVDSLKWEQYSERYSGIKKRIYQREGKTLSKFEKKVSKNSDLSIFVSQNEANCFKQRSNLQQNIISVNNGVDTQYFDANQEYENPFPSNDQFKIVFTGMMDYWPNIDAVTWFAQGVMPILRRNQQNVALYVVGGNPTEEVRKLYNQFDIHVTGRVPDMRPYLKYADCSVAPLRIARGIQNKVLEALSMNCPIVVSPEALEGISLSSDIPVDIAQTVEEWVDKIQDKIKHHTNRDIQTYPFIQKNYSWSASLNQLDKYLV